MAKLDVEKLKADGSAVVQAVTYFRGELKNKFLSDIDKGEKPADLLRQMAKVFYETKEARAKHIY